MEIENLYDTLMDNCVPEYAVKGVECIFTDDTVCDQLYAKVYEAKLRINQRIGTQEDSDVELIIRNLLEITRIVSYKMYQLGTNAEHRWSNTSTRGNS